MVEPDGIEPAGLWPAIILWAVRFSRLRTIPFTMNGGAGRDRTDDLKLAKLPLSQLSYGPIPHENNGGPGKI